MQSITRLQWRPRSRLLQFIYALLSFTLLWQQVLVLQPVEAAISQRGTVTSSNSGTSNVTSIAINKPTGTITGDVMLATIVESGNPTITAPSGWTLIEGAQTTSGTTMQMGTYYKVATSSEGTSYSWSWTGTQRASGTIASYAGVDNTAVIDNSGGAHSAGSGTGTALSTASVTTTSASTLLVASLANAQNSATNLPVASAATAGTFDSELTETASNSTTTPNVDSSVDSKAWSSSGASGTVSATATTSAAWCMRVVALKPAGNATINQADFRWTVNSDYTNPGYIPDDISSNSDNLRGTDVDTANGYFYAVGDNGGTSPSLVVERRRIADGALCTSTNCGSTFGTAGRVTETIASTSIKGYALAIDPNGGYIYIVGSDTAAGGGEFRIEKRNMVTGALVSGFGTNGIVEQDVSTGDDTALAVLFDSVNGYLYVGGYDSGNSNSSTRWDLQKYKASNGLICSAANCGTQFGTNGIYTYTNGNNQNAGIAALALDPSNNYLYVAGYSTANNGKTQWNMEKMLATTAGLCTAANCGTQFGTAGLYTSDPTSRNDTIQALQVDSAANAIYIGGYESNTTSSEQWRIEKITTDTGSLVTAFGGSGCTTNEPGAVCASFSSGNDTVHDMQLDAAGGYLYVLGGVNEAATDSSWAVQKRNRSDGSLVTSWGANGSITSNTSSGSDPADSLVLDVSRSIMWVASGDSTPGATNMEWYFSQYNLDVGDIWLAPKDVTPAVSLTISFRLRLLLGASTQELLHGGQAFKLQYSPMVGTCDSGFVGESYQDVPTSGSNEILYHNNPSVTSGTQAVALSGDPTDGTNPTVVQSIVQQNTFNALNDTSPGSDGEWDFAMNDNSAFGPYCFRVLNSNGSVLGTYTQIPSITFCKNDPKTDNLLRHGTYFCGGVKKSFFWAN